MNLHILLPSVTRVLSTRQAGRIPSTAIEPSAHTISRMIFRYLFSTLSHPVVQSLSPTILYLKPERMGLSTAVS